MDCLKPIIGGCGTPPNFAEKSFADGSQTSKSVKVFSLESFPLYGTCNIENLEGGLHAWELGYRFAKSDSCMCTTILHIVHVAQNIK